MAKTSKSNQKNTSYTNSSDNNNSNSNSSSDHAISKGKRKRKVVVPRDSPPQRSSIYRGVTRHRWTGRYEAHLWDKNCWNETQTRKGRQVYLGAYDDEEAAAHAYDLAALKYWGQDTILNFAVSTYEKELKEMEDQSREEYIGSLRRKSSGFSRGVSRYRGVARHHHNGRWEARIGRVFGNKYLYLGTYATQEEAAMAYDMAAIEHRGPNAVTNFDLSRYIKCNPKPKPIPNSTDLNPIPNTKEEIDFNFIRQQHEQQLQSLNFAETTVPPPHAVAGTAASSVVDFPETPPESERPRRSFPDDIQTYFDCQDSSSLVEEHDIIFGDLDSFVLPMFAYELNT